MVALWRYRLESGAENGLQVGVCTRRAAARRVVASGCWQQQLHVRVVRRRERRLAHREPRFRLGARAAYAARAAAARAAVGAAECDARAHERPQEALVQRHVQHEVERHAEQRHELYGRHSTLTNMSCICTSTVQWICEYLCDGAVGLEARAVEAAVVEEEHVDLRVGQRDRHVSYAQRRVDYCTARPYLLVHVSSPVPVLVTVHQR